MGRDYSLTTESATTYTTHGHLEWLIDGALEYEHGCAGDNDSECEVAEDLVPRGQGVASEALIRAWTIYESALHAALRSFASDVDHLGLQYEGSWADECMRDDGPLNVYHSLAGDGVGIWDGRWSTHFVDGPVGEATLEALQTHLKRKLGKYVDWSGAGSLVEAVRSCCFRLPEEND